MSEATAFIMASMMSDVINGGTGWQARRVGFTLPAAGKTGTTNDYHDAWFVGFTPHLVTGVWLGYDMPRTIIANGYAGELAVPLWGRFMDSATRGSKPDRFAMPSTVVPVAICRLSGKLPTDGCRSAVVFDDDGQATDRSMVYTEYFVRGTEPNDYCPLHLRDFDTVATSGDSRAGSPLSATTGTEAPDTTKADETGTENPSPERKRGFWGRIFGR